MSACFPSAPKESCTHANCFGGSHHQNGGIGFEEGISPVNTSSVAGLCHGIQIQLTRVSCVNLGRMFNPLAPFAVSLRCKTASCCQGSGGGVATPFPEVV